MSETLAALEGQRSTLLEQISQLGDFRSGSVTPLVRRCGKSSCHCAQPKDPGHGPNLRLTCKVKGKTVTEMLSDPGALRKAQREIAEFRKFQQLIRAFVEVNAQICRRRPASVSRDAHLDPEEKKRQRRSSRKSPRK